MFKLFGKKEIKSEEKDDFEKNGFHKFIKKDRKIVIDLFNKQTNTHETFDFEFETNKIYDIPNTDYVFAIAMDKNYDDFCNLFSTIDYNYKNPESTSPTRTYFRGVTEKCGYRYMFNYKDNPKLKIDSEGEYCIEISIVKL